MVLDADELQALGEAAHSGVAVVPEPRTRPFHLGRSDQDLSRAAAFLDIHVPAILKRVREATRHESGRSVTLSEVTPRLLPVQDLLLGEGASSLVLVEIAAGAALPPGLIIMNVHSARALALMAIAPSQAGATDVQRPISGTERRLLTRWLTSFLKAFERGLPKDTPLQPLRLQHLYNDPRELMGFDKSAPMVTLPISFEGDVDARLEFVIPSSWLVVGRHHGSSSQKGSGRRVGHDHSQVILEVSAELGRARLSLRRLLTLSPGDLVLLRSSPHAMVPVLIQGQEKLKARPEVRDGRVAMVIANDASRADSGGSAGDIADHGSSKDITPHSGETHG